MINAITYNNIIIELRKELLTQTELPSERILNIVSDHGADLSDIVNNSVATSFELEDTFILFEMLEEENLDNNIVVPDKESGTVDSLASFNFNLKIYGGACHELAQKIRARFKDSIVTYALWEKGIHINGISFPTTINEFINDTLWPRCDMSIKIRVRFNIQRVQSARSSQYADTNKDINVTSIN